VVSRLAIPPSVPPSRRSASSLSIEATPQPQVSLSARPLVDARERPAVGNIPQYEGKIVRKCGSPEDCGERPLTPGERARLAFQANQSVSRPLFDSREQPMVGNVSREGRRGPRTPREKLPDLAYRIRNLEDNMNAAQTADLRDQYRTALAQAIDDYIVLERKVKAGRGDEE
jgi:hypothetical protein